MIPVGAEQIVDGGFHGDRHAETVDQLAAVPADDLGAEDPAGLRVGDDLRESVFRLHQNRFAVIVEGIACRDTGNAGRLQRALAAPDHRHLRIGEDHVHQAVVVYR